MLKVTSSVVILGCLKKENRSEISLFIIDYEVRSVREVHILLADKKAFQGDLYLKNWLQPNSDSKLDFNWFLIMYDQLNPSQMEKLTDSTNLVLLYVKQDWTEIGSEESSYWKLSINPKNQKELDLKTNLPEKITSWSKSIASFWPQSKIFFFQFDDGLNTSNSQNTNQNWFCEIQPLSEISFTNCHIMPGLKNYHNEYSRVAVMKTKDTNQDIYTSIQVTKSFMIKQEFNFKTLEVLNFSITENNNTDITSDSTYKIHTITSFSELGISGQLYNQNGKYYSIFGACNKGLIVLKNPVSSNTARDGVMQISVNENYQTIMMTVFAFKLRILTKNNYNGDLDITISAKSLISTDSFYQNLNGNVMQNLQDYMYPIENKIVSAYSNSMVEQPIDYSNISGNDISYEINSGQVANSDIIFRGIGYVNFYNESEAEIQNFDQKNCVWVKTINPKKTVCVKGNGNVTYLDVMKNKFVDSYEKSNVQVIELDIYGVNIDLGIYEIMNANFLDDGVLFFLMDKENTTRKNRIILYFVSYSYQPILTIYNIDDTYNSKSGVVKPLECSLSVYNYGLDNNRVACTYGFMSYGLNIEISTTNEDKLIMDVKEVTRVDLSKLTDQIIQAVYSSFSKLLLLVTFHEKVNLDRVKSSSNNISIQFAKIKLYPDISKDSYVVEKSIYIDSHFFLEDISDIQFCEYPNYEYLFWSPRTSEIFGKRIIGSSVLNDEYYFQLDFADITLLQVVCLPNNKLLKVMVKTENKYKILILRSSQFIRNDRRIAIIQDIPTPLNLELNKLIYFKNSDKSILIYGSDLENCKEFYYFNYKGPSIFIKPESDTKATIISLDIKRYNLINQDRFQVKFIINENKEQVSYLKQKDVILEDSRKYLLSEILHVNGPYSNFAFITPTGYNDHDLTWETNLLPVYKSGSHVPKDPVLIKNHKLEKFDFVDGFENYIIGLTLETCKPEDNCDKTGIQKITYISYYNIWSKKYQLKKSLHIKFKSNGLVAALSESKSSILSVTILPDECDYMRKDYLYITNYIIAAQKIQPKTILYKRIDHQIKRAKLIVYTQNQYLQVTQDIFMENIRVYQITLDKSDNLIGLSLSKTFSATYLNRSFLNISDFDCFLHDTTMYFVFINGGSGLVMFYNWNIQQNEFTKALEEDYSTQFDTPYLSEIRCIKDKNFRNKNDGFQFGCAMLTDSIEIYEFNMNVRQSDSTIKISLDTYYHYYQFSLYKPYSLEISSRTITVLGRQDFYDKQITEEIVITYFRKNAVSQYAAGIMRLSNIHAPVPKYQSRDYYTKTKKEFIIVKSYDNQELLFIPKCFSEEPKSDLPEKNADRFLNTYNFIQLFTIGDNSITVTHIENMVWHYIKMGFTNYDGSRKNIYMIELLGDLQMFYYSLIKWIWISVFGLAIVFVSIVICVVKRYQDKQDKGIKDKIEEEKSVKKKSLAIIEEEHPMWGLMKSNMSESDLLASQLLKEGKFFLLELIIGGAHRDQQGIYRQLYGGDQKNEMMISSVVEDQNTLENSHFDNSSFRKNTLE